MPKLTPKEQKELLRLLKEQEKVDQKIAGNKTIQLRTAEKYEKNLKRINELQKKQNALTETQRDVDKEIEKTLSAIEKEQRKLNVAGDKFKDLKIKTLDVGKELLTHQQKNIKNSKISDDLLQQQAELVNDILIGSTDLSDLLDIEKSVKADILKAQEEDNDALVEHHNITLGIINAKKKELEQTEDETEKRKYANDLFGDFVDKAMAFAKANPLAKSIIAALALQKILTKAMDEYSKVLDEIGLKFGAALVGDFGAGLGMAAAHAKRLGFETSDVTTTFEKLNTQFGFGLSQSLALVDGVTDLARIMGTGVEEASQIVGMFTKLGGLSTDQALQLAKQTVQLAKMSGVAPNVVMKDIAESTELFAKYSKDGGKNIMAASVEARKLGLSLSTVEKISDGLLDFQSSLTAEYEASAILGRSLNLNRARELAMAGDQVGLLKEITRQVGSQAELERMSVFHRNALAKALQMETKDLALLVANQEKSLSVSKQLSEMSFSELIGEDALSGLTLFKNSLQTIGAILVQNFIPPISFVLGLFGSLVGWLAESEVGMVLLSAVIGALAIKMSVLSWAAIKGAAGLVMEAFGLLSVSTGGWGLAGYGAAAGIVAGMYSLYSKAPKLAGGAKVKASPGGSMVNVAEGGKDELITPMDKLGSLVNVDTSEVANEVSVLKSEMKETNQLLSELTSAMDSYFGSGGTAIKGIGKAMTKELNDEFG